MNFEHLYFCHIQKTAGTSLWSSACHHFEPTKVLYPAQESYMPLHIEQGLDRFDFIQGHISMCWSYSLGRHCLRFAFVRLPIERVLSLYNFWRLAYQSGGSAFPVDSGPYLAGTRDFSEFIRHSCNRYDIEDSQTRQIFGIYHSLASAQGISATDFSKRISAGKLNLWTMEEFPIAVLQLNEMWGAILFSADRRENETIGLRDRLRTLGVSSSLFRESDLSREDRDYLLEHLRLDFELYHFLRNREKNPKWHVPTQNLQDGMLPR